jgi:hypothetical protein
MRKRRDQEARVQLLHGQRRRRTLELRQPRTVRIERLRTHRHLRPALRYRLRSVRRRERATALHVRPGRLGSARNLVVRLAFGTCGVACGDHRCLTGELCVRLGQYGGFPVDGGIGEPTLSPTCTVVPDACGSQAPSCAASIVSAYVPARRVPRRRAANVRLHPRRRMSAARLRFLGGKRRLRPARATRTRARAAARPEREDPAGSCVLRRIAEPTDIPRDIAAWSGRRIPFFVTFS